MPGLSLGPWDYSEKQNRAPHLRGRRNTEQSMEMLTAMEKKKVVLQGWDRACYFN